jgi:septal ring factor EnvC (AmiA/AmiB activator)
MEANTDANGSNQNNSTSKQYTTERPQSSGQNTSNGVSSVSEGLKKISPLSIYCMNFLTLHIFRVYDPTETKAFDLENLGKAIDDNLSKWLNLRKEFDEIAQTTEKQIQGLTAEKKSLEEKKKTLETELDKVTTQLQSVNAEIERLEKERIERLRELNEKSKILQSQLNNKTSASRTN